MKLILKFICLLGLGLAVALFVYPVLHELGHTVVAWATGASVLEIRVLPVPSVLCYIETAYADDIALIGLGGMLFPFFATLLAPPKRFWGWYVWFVTKGICLLSFCISLVCLLLFQLNRPVPNEDITRVMTGAPQYAPLYYIALLTLTATETVQLIRSNPLRRCTVYFEV